MNKVSKFCIKYDILISKFDEFYVIRGRSRHRIVEYTVLHHYQIELTFTFNLKVTLLVLTRDDDKRFFGFKRLANLFKIRIEKKKHETYILVVRLVKFSLPHFSSMKLIKTGLRN
ncbi:hypothetical protein H5410_016595 [Solanum commersonii]|uniref:Uncharacterized protein n=1 Tax=Solanum commersonii TaxID=4109 RepID=A0A9J5ZXF5_SOLCO|nr:hypothetical protein H5410_016595 [Solanum commersonii]